MEHDRNIEKFRESVIKKVDELCSSLIELSETADTDTSRIYKIIENIEDLATMILNSLYKDICNVHRKSEKEK